MTFRLVNFFTCHRMRRSASFVEEVEVNVSVVKFYLKNKGYCENKNSCVSDFFIYKKLLPMCYQFF
jgi:hypothetical protein